MNNRILGIVLCFGISVFHFVMGNPEQSSTWVAAAMVINICANEKSTDNENRREV